MGRFRSMVAAAVLCAIASACTIRSEPTAGVRANPRGEAVIVVARCTDERIVAVQVADLDGAVRWRAEGGGNRSPATFVVGREPPLMRETDPLDGPLDASDAYVATVEYAGSVTDVDVEFRPSSLSTDRVVDADGDIVTPQTFADEADVACVGGWLWVFGGIALALVLGLVTAIVAGLIIVVRVARKARRERERDATPGRPDLSGR